MERDSFIIYRSTIDAGMALPPKQFKEWFSSVFAYGLRQEEPTTPIGKAAVESIRLVMDKDRNSYENVVKRNQENGRLGGRPRTENPENPDKPKETQWVSVGSQRNPEVTQNNLHYEDEYEDEDDNTGNQRERKRDEAHAFLAPTVDQVKELASKEGLTVDAESFVAYYEARGWKLSNGLAMHSWPAALRAWSRREQKPAMVARPPEAKPNKLNNFENRQTDEDAWIMEKIKRDRAKAAGGEG